MSPAPKKVSEKQKRDNRKARKTVNKRKKKAAQKKRKRNRRPKRNLLAGQRFHTLEAFIRWLQLFLGDLIDKKLKPKGNQAVFSNKALFVASTLRVILRIAHLSTFVEHLEANTSLPKALGFKRFLVNTKPLSEFLLKLAFPLARWLFLQVLLEARAHGLVFGKTISVDCCFLHVYGKTYQNAKRGYSGQMKRKMNGYKLWVVFSVESKMPLDFYLDSGNVGDTAYFKRCVGRANYVLGDGQLKWVLADRGFCSRELYYWLDRVMHLNFVFRAKAGKTNRYVQDVIDELNPSDYRVMNHLERYGKATVTGLKGQKLRLFVGKHRKFANPLLLITNDFSREFRTIKRYYLSRWSVETFFASEKHHLLLGHFSSTKWKIIYAEVTMSLLTSVFLRIFQLLLGRRYRKYGPGELIERILLRRFDCNFERLLMKSHARGRPVVAALQRLHAFLDEWGSLEKYERFEKFRPAGFSEELFLLPDISVIRG